MQESVFSMPVVVGESSIDLLGHVNNREYMRWMEAAAAAHAPHQRAGAGSRE